MSQEKSEKFGTKLGLSPAQATRLARLKTPDKIQDFVNKIPINYELHGETNLSVAESLRQRQAHCLEGAFIAACALWINGQPPLLMNMEAQNDDDHAVALFRRGKYWGAISKSNHVWLRWREPVYRTLRELALSYFHEYVTGPRQTLVAYSKPLDLRRFDPALWVSNKQSCMEVALALAHAQHYRLMSSRSMGQMRKRDPIEIKAGKLLEHPAPKKADREEYRYHT